MGTKINTNLRTAIALPVIAIIIMGCTTAPPTIDTSPDAEVSFDGLHVILNSEADKAWAVPGLDLSGYTKIMLRGEGIEYRPGGESGRTYYSRSRGGPYEVTEDQKERLLEVVREGFLEELAKSEKFTITDEVGPDVLMVRGGLLDGVSYVPPESISGRVSVYLSSVGEATLVIELRDSISGAILVRAVDRAAAEDISGMMESNRVTNTADVRRLVSRWGRALRERLDELGGAGS